MISPVLRRDGRRVDAAGPYFRSDYFKIYGRLTRD